MLDPFKVETWSVRRAACSFEVLIKSAISSFWLNLFAWGGGHERVCVRESEREEVSERQSVCVTESDSCERTAFTLSSVAVTLP